MIRMLCHIFNGLPVYQVDWILFRLAERGASEVLNYFLKNTEQLDFSKENKSLVSDFDFDCSFLERKRALPVNRVKPQSEKENYR